jgi:hypothetical protein
MSAFVRHNKIMGEATVTIFTVLLFIAAFVGSGAYTVLSIADFGAARRGFWATAISFAATGLVLGIMTTWSLPVRMSVCGAFFLVAGMGLVWMLDYLKVREALGFAKSPDVVMRLVYPKRPALVLENISDAVAVQIKYAAALLKITGPEKGQPVQIPISTFDFIKGREKGGPQNLFDPPAPLKSPNEGERLFGWIQVSCPTCAVTHYYWTYINFGYDGWYAEVSKARHEAIAKWLHENGPYTDNDIDRMLSVIDAKDRSPITAN